MVNANSRARISITAVSLLLVQLRHLLFGVGGIIFTGMGVSFTSQGEVKGRRRWREGET